MDPSSFILSGVKTQERGGVRTQEEPGVRTTTVQPIRTVVLLYCASLPERGSMESPGHRELKMVSSVRTTDILYKSMHGFDDGFMGGYEITCMSAVGRL